jgi:hypothetical protein
MIHTEYQGNLPWDYQYTLNKKKNEGQEENSIFCGHKEKGNEGVYGGCVLYPYLKIEEGHLLRAVRGRGRKMEGVNLTKIYCKHICKYHDISPCTNVIC